MKIRFNSTPTLAITECLITMLKEDSKHLGLCATHSRANRPILLNKTLTTNGIDIPDLTING
ncbi:hypothetical protein [Nostoc sp.]|uniref:hypothetical protein n=1 Tax=Nostoc sp. TaxID=1180 RepID=UPI002FF6B173